MTNPGVLDPACDLRRLLASSVHSVDAIGATLLFPGTCCQSCFLQILCPISPLGVGYLWKLGHDPESTSESGWCQGSTQPCAWKKSADEVVDHADWWTENDGLSRDWLI